MSIKTIPSTLFLAFALTTFSSTLIAQKNKTPSPLPGWMIKVDDKGRRIPQPRAVDSSLMNPVHSEQWLEAYRARADLYLNHAKAEPLKFNTFFENEKKAYGLAMSQILAGDSGNALSKLIEQDHQRGEWHKETDGIDYYACFTIKHQMRKYFYFGEMFPSEYKKQMFSGAKKWTEKDPLRRPHYAHQPGKQGWGPDAKNSWVDVRTTDNLTLMRNTSVYLMAEETGNLDVAKIYHKKIQDFVVAMYRTGNGEWDSENYLGHTFAPIFNTHDFAKDKDIRALSKAQIDWIAAAMAVKYFRGAANGPTKRDYNNMHPFGGSLAEMGWVLFGAPTNPHHHGWDEVHVFTSSYIPPPAIVNLGTNNFDRPRELLNSKPPYSESQDGNWKTQPSAHETYYIGHTFEFGSLAQGTSTDGGDESGFKIMAEDGERGVIDIQGMPGFNPRMPGSPVYRSGVVAGQNRVAQFRNTAIWLVTNPDAPWFLVLPNKVGIEIEKDTTFLKGEKTWFALQPINMPPFAQDPELTKMVQFELKKEKKNVIVKDEATGAEKKRKQVVMVEKKRWTEHQVISSKGAGKGSFSGFAIEIGEQQTHGSYEQFKKNILSSSKLQIESLDKGIVSYTSPNNTSVKMEWGDQLSNFKVWRNGDLHDWTIHGQYVWREAGKGKEGLIHQEWGQKGGTLTVNAGGKTFECSVDTNGKVSFANR